jgi:hypothetical protein
MNAIRKVRFSAAALGLAAAAALAPGASAQSVLIDQGTFRLSLAGREIGRDSFNIQRTGAGEDARIFVRGWVDVDRRRIESVVETTAGYGLTLYQAKITGAETADVMASVAGRRLETTVRSPAGEQIREARAREGAVVLEENVPHHYFFVGVLAREGGTLPVIVPRADPQASVEVQSIRSESVSVGGQQIDARRLTLSVGGVERRVWVDAQGRVLRVEIPSTGFLAERLRAPA